MKKVLAIVAILALVCTFSSCKKKCTCTANGVKVEYDLDELNKTYGVDIEKCTELSVPGVECK